MAKSRRIASGCKRGRYKIKKMGKGWSTMRRKRGSVAPIDRKKQDAEAAAAASGESASS